MMFVLLLKLEPPCFSTTKKYFKSIENVVCFTFKVRLRTSLLPKWAMAAKNLNSSNKYQFCSLEEDLIGDTEIEMVKKELQTSKT